MNANAAAGPTLPSRSANGRARAAALQAHRAAPVGVGTVSYRSLGRLLVIGDRGGKLAESCLPALVSALQCVLLTEPGAALPAGLAQGVVRLQGQLEHLEGYLGRFSLSVQCQGRALNPARCFAAAGEHIDLVLDLGDPPSLHHEVPPPGYYAARDLPTLERALGELRGLVGEFEKPRYFEYDASICAHGRSGLSGCRRCIDACPTLAIRSLGESIEVEPHLCQGGGACASACPTGAIRYAYPGVSVLLTSVREALKRYCVAGGSDPQVLFFDTASGQESLATLAGELPESALPFQVEELGSVGMDAWLATLAYGARRVVLFTTQSIPRTVLRELSLQISYARAILSAMGYRGDCVELVLNADRSHRLAATLERELPLPGIEPAAFMAFDEKRTTLNLAIDHLHAQAAQPRTVAELPDDAPFGTIQVDAQRCTLCMACVSVCPARALYAGDGVPALRFIENNCVQCGLCHAACPEDAVTLVPRMNFDRAQTRELRTLHEAQPFRCIRCGKPFATSAVVARMSERLAQHWMFRDERARRRIQMCQDCKAVDVFEQEGNPNVHDKPRTHS